MAFLGGSLGGIVGGAVGSLFSCKPSLVEQVMGQMTQQLNVIQGDVFNPVQKVIELVGGGSIWKGAGATAFQQELANALLPQLSQTQDQLGDFTKNVGVGKEKAIDADKAVESLVTGFVGDVLSSIF